MSENINPPPLPIRQSKLTKYLKKKAKKDKSQTNENMIDPLTTTTQTEASTSLFVNKPTCQATLGLNHPSSGPH